MQKVNSYTIVTLMFTSMLTIMVGAAIAPSLVSIVKNLNFKFSPALLITLPSLGVVVFSTLSGWLHQRAGSFMLLCFGLVAYAIFGFTGVFITNSYLMIANRLLLGGAAVAVQVSGTALIAENFVGEYRMKIIAWQGMAIEAGGVCFLILGGILGQMHWSYPFGIYLLGVLFLILVFLFVPKKASVLPTEEKVTSENLSNSKSKVLLIFLASLFSLIIFFVSITHLPQYLPKYFDFTESNTGFIMAFISVIAVLTASQMPYIVKRLGEGYTVVIGLVFYGIGYFVIASASLILILYIGAFMLGIGFGLTVPTLNHMMVDVSNSKNRGKNLSLYSMGVFGGQFASTFLGYIFKAEITLFFAAGILSFIVASVFFILFRKIK